MKPIHFLRCFLPVALLMATRAALPGAIVSITIAPPILPVYSQPLCPVAGYLWTPGYWGYGQAGYYWVPGVWVQPPAVGLLWTPGYWGFVNGFYGWHAGYWGPHVGFYGGVNYGYGFFGTGFLGGAWFGNHFRYNTAVVHVNTGVIHDTYINRTGIVEGGMRTSFNGPGGIGVRPNASELAAEHEHHIERTEMQASHEHEASLDRGQRFSENHGRPATAAYSRPGMAYHGTPENRAGGAINHGPTPNAGHAEVPRPPAAHAQTGGGAPQGAMRTQSSARPQGGETPNHGGPATNHGATPSTHGSTPSNHGGPPPKGGGKEGNTKGGEREHGRQ